MPMSPCTDVLYSSLDQHDIYANRSPQGRAPANILNFAAARLEEGGGVGEGAALDEQVGRVSEE